MIKMNKLIDKDKLQMYISITRIVIIICWVSLFCFWGIKLLGGNWFEIVVNNKHIIKLSNKLQYTWLKYLISIFTIALGNFLLFVAIAQQFYFRGKDILVFIILTISMWVVINFVPKNFLNIQFWYGYVVIICFGLFKQTGWKKIFGLIAVILQFLFSTISMVIRDNKLKLIDNYLILLVLLIDIYIMYALFYLYTNLIKLKKGV